MSINSLSLNDLVSRRQISTRSEDTSKNTVKQNIVLNSNSFINNTSKSIEFKNVGK